MEETPWGDRMAKTVKLLGYQPTQKPDEDEEVQWWRQWLVEIVFGLWNEKKQYLAKMGFPPRPIHQKEILREVTRRVKMLKDEGLWQHKAHEHNWIERRVNECATEEYGPKTDGILKIVNTTAGYYEPNPELFRKP